MPRPIIMNLREQGTPYLPLFDGFPYLVTKVVPTMYHIILLPVDLTEDELIDLGRRQVTANRLKTCLVLGSDDCVFFEESGEIHRTDDPPKSTIVVSDRLRASKTFPETEGYKHRKDCLEAFIASLKLDGYAFGDLTKGGREATSEELQLLEGFQDCGIPRGLSKCVACGDWFGQSLDPSSEFAGKIMRVHCLCENDNLCAFCGRPLADRKLNANFLGEDGDIWHNPGFKAFQHVCQREETRK